MSEPILTVLMTVRNGEPYLRAAVASILNQTYRNFRFLILDNASTDNSREIIRAFGDARIDLAELTEDIGQTAALNRGLDMITTPWVARMDADDVSLGRRLESQMAYVVRDPDVAVLGTWCALIDVGGKVTGSFRPPTRHEDILEAFTELNPLAHSSVVFNRRAVLEAGGYSADYRCYQDFALWLQVCRRRKVANLGEEHVHVRYHPSQATFQDGSAPIRRDEVRRCFRAARALPLSPAGRWAVRRSLARETLNLAEALSYAHRQGAALRWLAEFCIRFPDLWTRDASCRRRMAAVLIGARGRSLFKGARGYLQQAWSNVLGAGEPR